MTNYNDGNWWGFNGGECPVHPKTVVECVYRNVAMEMWETLRFYAREIPETTIAFRVIREHREPREFWIVRTDFSPQIYSSKELAQEYASKHGFDAIHVREVIED